MYGRLLGYLPQLPGAPSHTIKTSCDKNLSAIPAMTIYHYGHHPLFGDDILDHKYQWYLQVI
jgi:hypothetical protein